MGILEISGAIVLGYLMGWFPSRHDKRSVEIISQNHNDMKELCDKFADLSCQLFNQRNTVSQVAPTNMEPLTNIEMTDEELLSLNADLLGAING